MNKLIELFKIMAYRLSQASVEERVKCLTIFGKMDGFDIKMAIVCFCEIYVDLSQNKISKDKAIELINNTANNLKEKYEN